MNPVVTSLIIELAKAVELPTKATNDKATTLTTSSSTTTTTTSTKGYNQLQLTEEQQALGIPSYLVYLAGLLSSSLLLTIGGGGDVGDVGGRTDVGGDSNPTLRHLSGPPYSKLIKDRFQEYQCIYHENITKKNNNKNQIMNNCNYYSLSPRVVPTSDQQKYIDQDIAQKLKELEIQTNNVIKGLEENNNNNNNMETIRDKNNKVSSSSSSSPSPSAVKKKQTRKKHKSSANKASSTKGTIAKNNSSSVKNELESSLHENKNETSYETLEELQLKIQQKNSSCTTSTTQTDDVDNEEAWVTVSKKGSKITDQDNSSNNDDDDDDDDNGSDENNHHKNKYHSDVMLQEITNKSFRSFDETGTRAAEQNSLFGTQQNKNISSMATKAIQPSFANAVANNYIDKMYLKQTATSVTIPSTTATGGGVALEPLQEQIRVLQMKLAEKEEQLAKERKEHAKKLRAEKERSDDLVQSLQLRLYISETRLKTYQDALEQHMQAVATNVAPNSYASSPMRKSNASNTEQNPPPSSPLISRVLQQQNRL